jgi:hypothetical protein
MTDELEGIWKEVVVTYLSYYPGIFMEGLTRPTKDLSLFGPYWNRASFEYKFRPLPQHRPAQ